MTRNPCIENKVLRLAIGLKKRVNLPGEYFYFHSFCIVTCARRFLVEQHYRRSVTASNLFRENKVGHQQILKILYILILFVCLCVKWKNLLFGDLPLSPCHFIISPITLSLKITTLYFPLCKKILAERFRKWTKAVLPEYERGTQ